MTARPITIVIPNFNGAHLLRRNLPSVMQAAAQYPGDARVLVVDDGSSDDSVEVMRQEFSAAGLVVHAANRGFADAIHTGVEQASTELLFLLNSDVELHVGCLEHLEPYFADPDVFSVCPLILREDGSVNPHSWNFRVFRRGYLKLHRWNLDAARESRKRNKLPTLYASGGGMLVSKTKFLALGGFDSIFKPYYGEDFDLGIRAWYRGWPSYFEPEATLVHQSQGSIKESAKRSNVKTIRRRNKYFIEWIHMPAARLFFTTLPITLIQLLFELLRFDRVNLRGFVLAIRSLPAALAARRSAQGGQEMGLPAILAKIQDAYSRSGSR
ncbi:glycosyltransferase family 2 protein [Thiosocius teredinicola]|uniref:glycosyltransferase family 2 protein n=1 Tax=Thiosocius teredinicola TaxID=1973002 RepID=UPI0013DDB430